MPAATGHLLAQLFPRLAHAFLDDVRLNLEAAGYGFHIDLAFDGVRNLRYGIGNLIDQIGLFEGVVPGFLQHEVRLEHNPVLLVLRNERLDFLQRVLTGEGVWVVPVREEHHARIHAFPKDEADGADGGMQTGFVTVVHDGDVLGELAY